MITRREALKTTALVTAAAIAAPGVIAQTSTTAAVFEPYKLPALPYAVDALEPHLDARTMEIHHGRHHKAYVDNLNKALVDTPELAKKSVENLLGDLNSVPEANRKAVENNGGGHFNHSLFWQMMKKNGGGEPKGELAKAIEANFGNLTDFKSKFNEAATKVFGSGWAWLVLNGSKLEIIPTFNQGTFLGCCPRKSGASLSKELQDRYGAFGSTGIATLLGLDVWEHAYYLKYQNKRADYIAAWWNVVNWDFVAERYAKLKG